MTKIVKLILYGTTSKEGQRTQTPNNSTSLETQILKIVHTFKNLKYRKVYKKRHNGDGDKKSLRLMGI